MFNQTLHIILQVISSGYKINYNKFQDAMETARKFVELYSWYYMTTSMHKLLIYSSQVIAHALLRSIIRRCSKQRYQKISWRLLAKFENPTLENIFNQFIVIFDPYISSIKKLPQKKLESLSREAVELLFSSTVSVATGTKSDSTIDSEVNFDSDVDSDSDIDSD